MTIKKDFENFKNSNRKSHILFNFSYLSQKSVFLGIVMRSTMNNIRYRKKKKDKNV